MRKIDLTEFNNPNNWRVIHDPDSQMFFLKNDNGNRVPGNFTTRVFAEQALYTYLENIAKKSKEMVQAKEAEKARKKRSDAAKMHKVQLTPGKEKAARV